MNRQAIIERVKIVLDEFTPVNQGVVHPIDTYIDPILDDSVRTLLKEFPIDKLWHERHNVTAGQIISEENLVSISIVDEIIRIASVKLPGWKREIQHTEFFPSSSIQTAYQTNPTRKATSGRPVVIFSQAISGEEVKRTLKCFGTQPITGAYPHAEIELTCVKLKSPEQLNDDLITPLTYLVASLIATHIERPDISKPIYEQYLKHLQ